MDRVAVVLAVLALVAVGRQIHRRRLVVARQVSPNERLPDELTEPETASHTWVLVTAPLCAPCGPVEERLRRLDPAGRLVKVDVAQRPDLAAALRARTAPTVLLAGPDGQVRERFVGAGAAGERSLAAALASVGSTRSASGY